MASFGEHPPLPETLESLLLDETVSTIFLKAECKPRVKSGHISSLSLNDLDREPWDKPSLEDLSDDLSLIIEQNTSRSDCFVEIQREGCKVMQIGDLRVSCAWPPFSDAWEITVVRPVANLKLSDYQLDQELINRISNHHRGIFVVGKPSIRLIGIPAATEIIFLLRPDFVIFDEVRRTRDFEIFGDVRLAGVGLLGVTHANSGLQAIQRLVGKVELGLISQVLDTVIHIEKGKINQVLELKMVVRAPTGMESDLSRPVIEIREFPSNVLTHEMFAFGSEIAVVPVNGEGEEGGSPAWKLAAEELKRETTRLTGITVKHAKFITDSSAAIYVDDSAIGSIIGSGGEGIRRLEQDVGVKLDVNSIQELPRGLRKKLEKNNYPDVDTSSWSNKPGRNWDANSGKSKKGKGRKNRR